MYNNIRDLFKIMIFKHFDYIIGCNLLLILYYRLLLLHFSKNIKID
jgi:hypothetical protein